MIFRNNNLKMRTEKRVLTEPVVMTLRKSQFYDHIPMKGMMTAPMYLSRV